MSKLSQSAQILALLGNLADRLTAVESGTAHANQPAVTQQPQHPLDGRPVVPQDIEMHRQHDGSIDHSQRKMVPMTDGTINDNEYPTNSLKDGKLIKVQPVYRKRMVEHLSYGTIALDSRFALRDGATGQSAGSVGTLKPVRFSTGNHGLQGEVAVEVTDADGYTYTFSANINLMLKDVTPPRMPVKLAAQGRATSAVAK